MTAPRSRNRSLWVAEGPLRQPDPALDGELHADVAVLGGGIVGLTTALLLQEQGRDVVLLEADRLAQGVSGYTTAKVTSQHGLIYGGLTERFGEAAARTYGEANEAALAWVAERIAGRGIDCSFRRQPAYAYGTSQESRAQLEAEAAAARRAGLPASLVETSPLPYPVSAAVRFEDQAEFDPYRYLLALADQLRAAGGRIHERSRAVEVGGRGGCRVKTAGGRVLAEHVVVATHYPFLDRGLAFARVQQMRSYAIACRIRGELPTGMHISADQPTRSIRAARAGTDDELLLVGGEGHRTGDDVDTEARYRRLEEFAREHWDVASIDYRWSAQDGVTIDSLPFVGRVLPWSNHVLMATGFGKWGMTGGTAAALTLADLVSGREDDRTRLFDPIRLRPRASLPKLARENGHVAWRFVRDRVAAADSRTVDELEPGEGAIVRHEGGRIAAYRGDDGTLSAVSPRCTHLGCHVAWNSAERSWDCPCHGSRFAPDGSVLEGPAVHRLEAVPLQGVEVRRASRS